ncbi:phosphatidic acid phosphohydrolase 2 [Striga asiatica]|uniref:Phosphatidic acid phosphohydrolase 2 n=1 Tax=Striga asiatica TaxID=4170 RepID=A0A5A7QAE0_STRAF|nr:phosphatidic acid phosphohydrolase 2 [Striga asiatica]
MELNEKDDGEANFGHDKKSPYGPCFLTRKLDLRNGTRPDPDPPVKPAESLLPIATLALMASTHNPRAAGGPPSPPPWSPSCIGSSSGGRKPPPPRWSAAGTPPIGRRESPPWPESVLFLLLRPIVFLLWDDMKMRHCPLYEQKS